VRESPRGQCDGIDDNPMVLHTNSIEGVWALLKRQIVGIHNLGFVEALVRVRC